MSATQWPDKGMPNTILVGKLQMDHFKRKSAIFLLE